MNVFISHAMADKGVAGKIASELKAQGFNVMNPMEDVALGENFALKLGRALEQADSMVALLSPDSARAEWVQNEIGYALATPKFQNRLIPVMLKKTEKVPWILHNLNVLTWSGDPAATGRAIATRLRQSSKSMGVRYRRADTLRQELARQALARV